MFENRKIDWDLNEQSQPKGTYHCSQCSTPLFSSDQKFDSKTGFPSFWAHLGQNVQQHLLETYGRERIQLLCHQCGLHLGHLFPDPRTPSQVRYCINAESILLQK
ncbi:peptide-methionine (R)-S-oxide reductase [Rufibacter tibetensis]|uniref:peptide-methionine (R)-S-oxide reductase n=1 Tax=Rufibacter tibetensis TaxID=512763 RepID=A0A0P0CZX6_9BACT|nr:peptide-methionine (R)-S-oxide reductase [Rufibacter tibetensis]ALJ01047.1 methionine-R-sulfoxide reductase [Rufibacter tibetensis]